MSNSSNRRAWLSAAISALASLVLSALLLWLLLPTAYPEWAAQGRAVEPTRLAGERFDRVPAAAVLSQVDAGERPSAARGQFLLRAGARLSAADYPQLALDIESVSPESGVYLFWRTGADDGAVASVELEGVSEGESWHSVANHEDWEGTIVEVAVGAFDGMGRPRLELSSATFHGATRAALLERSWAQWRQFQPWRMSSVNQYPGARGDVLLHPAAAVAAWSTLSVVFFLAAAGCLGLPRRALVAVLLAVLFLPWIGLDRLWQSQLERQLDLTRDRFAGLTQAEKHEREMDADLQRYAARLSRFLPREGDQRVFLLHDSRGHNYWRLRLQFHLLPRNIYNFGRELLPPGRMRPGDYVLLLDPLEDIRFDARRGVLTDGEHQWPARRVDRHPFGRLYRLEDAERSATAPEAE